jgi:hypothetical protein
MGRGIGLVENESRVGENPCFCDQLFGPALRQVPPSSTKSLKRSEPLPVKLAIADLGEPFSNLGPGESRPGDEALMIGEEFAFLLTQDWWLDRV